MNLFLEILRATAYLASTVRSVLYVYGWWKEYPTSFLFGRAVFRVEFWSVFRAVIMKRQVRTPAD